jgi:hypothetical protein
MVTASASQPHVNSIMGKGTILFSGKNRPRMEPRVGLLSSRKNRPPILWGPARAQHEQRCISGCSTRETATESEVAGIINFPLPRQRSATTSCSPRNRLAKGRGSHRRPRPIVSARTRSAKQGGGLDGAWDTVGLSTRYSAVRVKTGVLGRKRGFQVRPAPVFRSECGCAAATETPPTFRRWYWCIAVK